MSGATDRNEGIVEELVERLRKLDLVLAQEVVGRIASTDARIAHLENELRVGDKEIEQRDEALEYQADSIEKLEAALRTIVLDVIAAANIARQSLNPTGTEPE